MNVNDAELWAGTLVLLVSAAVLFSPFVLDVDYTSPLFVVGVVGLAVGSILVGLSRRGRPA